jgi:hypothetical protein
LLVCGLFGAVLVHLAAFHLWPSRSAAYLLQHCPWRPVLLIISAAVCSNAAIFWRDLRSLLSEHRALSRRPGRDRTSSFLPRRVRRLLYFSLCLFLIEFGATALAMRAMPMQMPMLAHGHQVLMTIAPLFPLPLGQALVAIVLAWVLWRHEHRVRLLRRVIALLRLLLLRSTAGAQAPLPRAMPALPRLLHGFQIFSRPPPAYC